MNATQVGQVGSLKMNAGAIKESLWKLEYVDKYEDVFSRMI